MLPKPFSSLIFCSNCTALVQEKHREVAIIASLLWVSHEGPQLAHQPLGPPEHFTVVSAQLWHHSPHPNVELSHGGYCFSGRGIPKDAADY